MRYQAALLVLLISCTQRTRDPVTIIWETDKAVSISVTDSVEVHLKNSQYPVLGELSIDGNRYIFTPQIPFQRGETYLVISKTDTLSFTVPPDTTQTTPRLLATYPSCDTVPSNLLKVYLQFSEPMQEYRSSQFVRLFDDVTGDTVTNAFLDLQPELWNDDGTVLTLWIDPGRVKQDLIPNRSLGAVLTNNHGYRLEVSKGWKSKKGSALTDTYSKRFVTSGRDVSKPHIDQWTIEASNDTVVVNVKETLDWMLLLQSISIRTGDQQQESKTFSEVCERQLIIVPVTPLRSGTHTLMIEALLEDPAGNNLNRLFETDVTGQSNKSVSKDIYALTFNVN